MPTGRCQLAKQPPRHSGHDHRTTHQWEAAPNGGKRGIRGIMIRCDDRPRDSTAPQPAIKTGQTPSHHHWCTPKAESAGSWMGCPGQGSSRPSLAAPRLLKSPSRSGASDGGINPGHLTGPTRAKGSLASSLGRERDGPLTGMGATFVPKPTSPEAQPLGTHGGLPT